MQVFCLDILKNPLLEYVSSFDTYIWVPEYSIKNCVYDQNVDHVAFVQRGPQWDLFEKLISQNICVSIINTEQMTRFLNCENKNLNKEDEVPFPMDRFVFCYIRSRSLYSIIDYSFANIKIWKSIYRGLNVELRCLFPSYRTAILPKTNDAIFVGDPASQHRQDVLTQLKPTILWGIYGKERDVILYSHKILVNVHYGRTYTVFEELRCLPCVMAKMIVVSETSQLDTNHPLHKFIIFAAYNQLASKVQDVIANYDSVYETIYANHDINLLAEDIRAYEESIQWLL